LRKPRAKRHLTLAAPCRRAGKASRTGERSGAALALPQLHPARVLGRQRADLVELFGRLGADDDASHAAG